MILRRLAWYRQFSAARLWYYSCKAYKSGNLPLAFFLKAINYFVFKAILSYKCDIQKDIELAHYGFGCVVDANVTIGKRVRLFHHVTLAAQTEPGVRSAPRIIIEDDCSIGAYAFILGNDRTGVRIGKGAYVGAATVVVRDVAPGAKIVAMPSRPVVVRKEES
jgi:serine acetyltransferase